MSKKNTDIVINPAIISKTLTAYSKEIKSKQAIIDKQYKALHKEEDKLYELKQASSDLRNLLRSVSALDKAAA